MLENYVAVCQFTVGEKKIIEVCVNIYGIWILTVVVKFYFNMYEPKSH